jgi:menaquinone-dependent protoporphyrinogen IX oxidase
MATDSRVLVAFVTAGGATEQYARVIGDRLRERGHAVDLVDLKRTKVNDLSNYSAIVLGTGVRVTLVYRKGKRFLARKDLKGKPLAIYLSSGMAIDDRAKAKERFLAPIIRKNGLSPIMYDAFPGKMPGQGGKLEDKSDPEAARHWADMLADRLEQ